MPDHLPADPRAFPASTLLDQVRRHHRRSLDRAKFWNNCAQAQHLTSQTRAFCRRQREIEAEHRLGLRQLRLNLSSGRRLSAQVAAAGSASDCLTRTLQRFLQSGHLDPLPDWLTALTQRSAWLDSIVRLGTASSRPIRTLGG